jgi:MraZ protein
MFRGNFEHTINSQGRVSLPSRFRQVLTESFGDNKKVVLVGLPDRIEVYPEAAYRDKETADLKLPDDDPRVLQYLAMQHYNVFEAEIDSQGRILVPPKLREDLGFIQDVIIIGLMNRILLFTPEHWKRFLDEAAARHAENSLLVSTMRGPKARD